MPTYPYVYSAVSLKKFIQMIPDAKTPAKVTQEYLEAAGLKSKNDRAIIPVLKFVGFLNEDGTPTPDYTLLRDKSQSGAVMASHLRKAYQELFDMFPDAYNKSNDAPRNFFATKTTGAGAVVGQIISTFKTLCETADFGAEAPSSAEPEERVQKLTVSRVQHQPPSPETGVTVNLNIQLQLPPTEDASIYDKIFESLKKHLLKREPATNT